MRATGKVYCLKCFKLRNACMCAQPELHIKKSDWIDDQLKQTTEYKIIDVLKDIVAELKTMNQILGITTK